MPDDQLKHIQNELEEIRKLKDPNLDPESKKWEATGQVQRETLL